MAWRVQRRFTPEKCPDLSFSLGIVPRVHDWYKMNKSTILPGQLFWGLEMGQGEVKVLTHFYDGIVKRNFF